MCASRASAPIQEPVTASAVEPRSIRAVPTPDTGDWTLALIAEAELPEVVSNSQPGFGEFLNLLRGPALGVLS